MNIKFKPVEEINEYFDYHIEYLKTDILPYDDSPEANFEEDLQYFGGDDYRNWVRENFTSENNNYKLYIYYIYRDQERIGAFKYVIYKEGEYAGECMLMDFWLFPPYRSKGAGEEVFNLLVEKAKSEGATHFVINSNSPKSRSFWARMGFVDNGVDEQGGKLMRKKFYNLGGNKL